jgi:cytidylate kinase
MEIKNTRPIIIAIDGFSSCGKSTLAKQLAAAFGLVYIDTGAMYRAVTLYFIENGVDIENKEQIESSLDDIHIEFKILNGVNTTFLNGRNVETDIRSMKVSAMVSQVAAISMVRRRMVALQQRMGNYKGGGQDSFCGVVMDGRDIGTVVFTDADIKFFITADPEVRAKRRHREIIDNGGTVSFEDIIENVTLRDKIDTSREDSPLRMADDAVLIDNTNLTIQEQLNQAIRVVREFLAEREEP